MIRLASLLSRMDKHTSKARALLARDLSDEIVFNALAMECFQAVNSAIDLGELIVSENNLGFPAKYREVFELLHEAKIIGNKTLDDIKRLIFLRNLISHEYYNITQEEIREMASRLDSLEELAKNAKTAAQKKQ